MTYPALGVQVTVTIGSLTAVIMSLFAAFQARRRAPGQAETQGPAPAFIAAALFAAMMGALIYQGVRHSFWPDYVGAAVFLVGLAITLRMGFRRLRA